MPDRPRVFVDLIVVSALVRLVTKEVDRVEYTFLLHMLETVGFIPSLWEHVEGNLSTNAEGESVVAELGTERLDEVTTDVVDFVIGFKVMTLLDTKWGC